MIPIKDDEGRPTTDVRRLSQELERVSERSAETFNIERDATWFVLKLREEVG